MDCQPTVVPGAPTADVSTSAVLRMEGGTGDLHCCCCCFQPQRRAALLESTPGDYLLSLFQYLNTISHPEGNSLSHETAQNNNESWNLSEMANNDDSIHITFPGVNSATIKSLPSVGWLLSEKAAFAEPFSLFCILWAASLPSCCNPQAVSHLRCLSNGTLSFFTISCIKFSWEMFCLTPPGDKSS